MRAENVALGRSGSPVFPLPVYIYISYIYLCLTSLTFGSLFSIARYARSFLSASSSYPDIFCIYFQELEKMLLFWNIMAVFSQKTVKFSILENIALYFQNLIERFVFMCALAYARAQKLPLFSGTGSRTFLQDIYLYTDNFLFFDFFRYLYRDRYLQERLGRDPLRRFQDVSWFLLFFRFSTFSIPVVSYLYETLYSVSRIQI